MNSIARFLRKITVGNWVTFLACLTPFCITLWVVGHYAVPVPVGDSFAIVDLIENSRQYGLFHIDSIFMPVQEQQVVFPIIIMYALELLFPQYPPLSAGNLFLLDFMAPILTALSLAMMALLVRSTMTHRTAWTRRLTFIIMCVLFLSLSQWETWSTINFSFALTVVSFMVALTLLWLRPHKPWMLALAAMLCFVSSFSISNGLMSWIALLPILLFPRLPQSRHQTRINAIVWILCTAATFVLFSLSYFDPHPATGTLSNPYYVWQVIRYFFVLFGLPIANFFYSDPKPTFLVGLFVFVTFIVLTWRSWPAHRKRLLPWVCIFTFGTLSAVLVTIGRNEYGLLTAQSSRYISFMCLPVLALVATIAIVQSRRTTRTLGLILTAVVLLQIPFARDGLEFIGKRSESLRIGATCMENYYIATNDCLGILFFGKGEFTRIMAERLDRVDALHIFHLPDDVRYFGSDPRAAGWVDTLVVEQTGSLVRIGGWALLDGCAATDVVLTAGPERTLVAHTKPILARPDAGSGCKKKSGWEVTLDMPRLQDAAKNYPLEPWIYDPKTKTLLLMEKRVFQLQLNK